jgi:5'-phosphate synthase pdxT subunit
MDIRVQRNAFGRQVDSFEIDLEVSFFDNGTHNPYHAIFIRAPIIQAVEGDAQTLLTLPDGRIVAAQQGKLLATSFHPELTSDTRFHQYFLALARS